MTMNKPGIKDIKKQFASLVDSPVNLTTLGDFGLQKMQTINFLSRSIQGLENRRLTSSLVLLHEIDMNCANLYKSVQSNLT